MEDCGGRNRALNFRTRIEREKGGLLKTTTLGGTPPMNLTGSGNCGGGRVYPKIRPGTLEEAAC